MKNLSPAWISLIFLIIIVDVKCLYANENTEFCWSCLGYSPIFESNFGEKEYSFGIEVNAWMPEFIPNTAAKDEHGNQQGPNELKIPVNGFGVRYVERNMFDRQYISPYLLSSIALISGVSMGPELGVASGKIDYGISGRFWLFTFGMEYVWTRKTDVSIMLYIFIPFINVSI